MYYNTVIAKINSKHEKEEVSNPVVGGSEQKPSFTNPKISNHQNQSMQSPQITKPKPSITQSIYGNLVGIFSPKNNFQSNKSKRSTKIDKSKIGDPTNCLHVQHIGLTNNTFAIKLTGDDKQSQKMQKFLSDLGVPKHKVTKEIEELVDGYIRENGGYDLFQEELEKEKYNFDNLERQSIETLEPTVIRPASLDFYLEPFETLDTSSVLPPPLPPMPKNIINQTKLIHSSPSLSMPSNFFNQTVSPVLPPPPIPLNISNQTSSTPPPPPPPLMILSQSISSPPPPPLPPMFTTSDNYKPSPLSDKPKLSTAPPLAQDRPNFLKEIEGIYFLIA